MKLNNPFYIDKRTGENHISLDGEWSFTYLDGSTEDISSVRYDYRTNLPASLYTSLCEAGILPHPYYGTNSKEYHWVDEKVWYYEKRFTVNSPKEDMNAYLTFEGVAYYCRIWLNGHLLGDHEGMFGGPVCDVAEFLNFDGENTLTVEVKACNYGKKEGYDPRNTEGENREIIPWNTARDTITGGGDFIIMGIWNSVRLEILPKIHLSRPYIYTKSVSGSCAKLHFEAQITDGENGELSETMNRFDYLRAKLGEGKKVLAEIKIFEEDTCVYESAEDVAFPDFHHRGLAELVPGYGVSLFCQKEISIKNPRLWYPVGMGEPFLYKAEVSLSYNGEKLDTQTFNFGIRTFEADYVKSNRYCTQPGKFLFSVNGKEFFLKGMNWMPIDFIYDMKPERYEWCLSLVKNAGIQLIRVWNGGGIPETDVFYELCDRLGIMVWQDQYISNTSHTQNWPVDIVRSQCAYNLFRIRNHPSLVVVCGGNEFDPYSPDNARTVAATEQTARMLTPDRDFRNASPDTGSGHLYLDMEPVWYRHGYSHMPFLAESGIHCFPNHKTLKKFISQKEADGMLDNLSSREFRNDFPELLNHFTEYDPDRVPRMTSRMSQIIDMKKASLKDVCEASGVQSYEFYQLMIQSMQESYPACGGIMPWVFKRPWPTVGVQTVDGDDRPVLAYYSVLNSYKNINVCWCQQWSVVRTGERLPLTVKVFNQNGDDLYGAEISLTIFNPDLSICKEFTASYNGIVDFGSFTVPENFKNSCFLVCADVSAEGKSIARSVYFNKCTDILEDEALYEKYRTEPSENLYFKNPPFLKEEISSAKKAVLTAEIKRAYTDGSYACADIVITNASDSPAYPVTVDTSDDSKRIFLSENFFMLMPGEEKCIKLTSDSTTIGDILVLAWNAEGVCADIVN